MADIKSNATLANAKFSVVIGDVNGHISEVFDKLTKLHAKHAFSFAIIAGNLFADPSTCTDDQAEQIAKLLGGQIEIPLPTYFALGTRALPSSVVAKLTSEHGELCPNLSILGRKTSVKTSEGITLVAVGGKYTVTEGDKADEYDSFYTNKDVEAAKGFQSADILITSDWPAEIKDGSQKAAAFPITLPAGERCIGDLCSTLMPKYHFSTSLAWFEREPFFHNGPAPRSITRFLSLAPYGNPGKQKWMYAFSLEPRQTPPQDLPVGATASPFMYARKRKLDESEQHPNGFRFSHDRNSNREYRPNKRGRNNRHQRPQPNPRECFFCLGGQNVEQHMVTSIGEEVYMTVAKGPLSTQKTFPGLGMPCHVLIIPLQHAPTIQAFDDSTREATHKEMKQYREALHSMVAAKSTKGEDGEAQLGAVTWEISRGGGVHLHWQFLPMPVSMIKRGLIEAAFDVEAENLSYPKFAKTEEEKAAAEKGQYFKAMIWSESKQKEIVLPLNETFRFDLQFGRRVLGKLLELENRSHWRDVVQTQEEEKADAAAFTEAFKDYDPSNVAEAQAAGNEVTDGAAAE